jgi:hypothetical protein
MADVYTVDDNLYSGALVTWAPDGESISSIALEYVLRFKSQVGHNNGRRKEFIKNNGHLVILASQIRTVHFWELRKGTTARVSIFEPGDIERLKWNIVLNAIYPDFMASIQAILWLQDKDLMDFSEELSRWAEDHGLTSHMRSIRVLRGTRAAR